MQLTTENPFFSKTIRNTSTRAKSCFQLKALSSYNVVHAYLLILAEREFYMYVFIALGTF